MLFLPFVVAVIVAAYAASKALWKWGASESDAPGPWERAATVGVLAFAIAVGVDWALALAHVFNKWSLLIASAALVAVSARSFAGLGSTQVQLTRDRRVVIGTLAPVVVWAAYAIGRDTIVFPWMSDALSYHLPKALFIVRSQTYAFFDGPDMRLSSFPANYEMLLADVLALTGAENLTGAIGVFAYLAFGLVVAGMSERWWGRGKWHVLVPALLALAMPTAVLSSGVHKNDLMMATMALASAFWASRWAVTGGRAALVLGIACTSLALGTKVNAGVLLPALVPVVLWRARAWWRDRGSSPGEMAAWVVGGAALGALLGGAAYLYNIAAIGSPLAHIGSTGYGDWKNLWMFPYLVFVRPLILWRNASYVPWTHSWWMWPENDVFFSTYGLQSTLALFAMPVAIAKWRHAGRGAERGLTTITVLLAWIGILPTWVDQPPVGFFEGFVRYTQFFPPVLLLWTFAPAVLHMQERWQGVPGKRAKLASWSAVAAGVIFAGNAVRLGLLDPYASIRFVGDVFSNEKLSRILRTWTVRAGAWVDGSAEPDDVIAFDGGFDAWIYPAYGAELRRKVVFLHSERGGPVVIPDEAKWVAVDRSWHCAFGAPGFADFSTLKQHFLKGKPLPEDLIVFNQLVADRRFVLLYHDEKANQAVFVRASAMPAPGADRPAQ